MNFKLSYLIFLFLPVLGFSQQKNKIQIHQDLFSQAEKSLLILSDSLGEVLSFKIITDVNSINGRYDFEFDTKSTGVKHFTIVNEYLKKVDNRTGKCFNAITYANIPDLLHIESEVFFENSLPVKSEMESTVIFIKGVDVLNDIEVFETPYSRPGQPRRSYRYQKKRKTLKINWTGFNAEDLYFYMRCNDEDEYRFVYISNAEINDKIYLEYNDLPNGLDTISINIENGEKVRWWSSVNFKSDASSNNIRVNSEFDEEFEYPFKYLIPADDSFYDFELTLTPIMKGTFLSYNFKNNGVSSSIKINPLEIEPDVEREFEEESVEIVNYSEAYKWDNFILSKTMIRGIHSISHWQVKGKFDNNYLNFQYPHIDEFFKNELESLKIIDFIWEQYYKLKSREENGKSISLIGVEKKY